MSRAPAPAEATADATAEATAGAPTAGTANATAAVLRTEARLFAREPMSVFWIVLFPPLLLLVMGAVPRFREASADLDGQSLIDLYTPVVVLLAMIMASVNAMPPVLLGYREAGVLRRLRTTPLDPALLLLAQVLLHAAAVLVSVALTLVIARMVFSVPLPGSPGGYAVALLLTLGATVAVGALITALAPNPRTGVVLSMAAFIPLMFTSGVYFPVQAMTGTLRAVVDKTPLGAGVQALDDATVGTFPALADLAVTGGWAALLGLLAVVAVRRG
jgi:ABC-2 type transport system permease protein